MTDPKDAEMSADGQGTKRRRTRNYGDRRTVSLRMDPELHERIRQHGNFIEWVPLVLLLMVLAEGNRAGATWLHVAGALLLAGRLMHPFGLKVAQPSHPMRIAGNTASLLAMLSMVVCLLVTLFQR